MKLSIKIPVLVVLTSFLITVVIFLFIYNSGLFAVPIIMLGIIVIILALFRFVINPINKLTQATKEIASGNLTSRVDINSKDEFGILAASFNEMTNKLQDLCQNQEIRIKEQTVDLEKKMGEAEVAKKATLNVLEDLSEEKEKLQQSTARDDAILSNIGDGLVVTDEKGIIQIMNRAAEKMLGWKEDEVKGKLYSEMLILEDEKGNQIPDEMRPLALVLKGQITDITLTKEYHVVRKDGSKFTIWNIVSPVILNNKIIGGINAFRDVTKEKQIDRMKTEFISLASHQLRTPLSAIKWFVELLNETELDKEQKDLGTNIAVSTERMIDLVNSLLNVSRIESGRIIISPKPTNLGDLVKEVTKGFQQLIDERKLIFNINVMENLPDINIDPQLITEVYINLLTNAIKYSPVNGKIDVIISIKDNKIISQVADTGIGIPEEDNSKVFTKFYRSADAIKLEPNGTGLGLYLVKAIVEFSGGGIWFENNKTGGVTFSFSLPLSGTKPKVGEVSLDN